jgi:hypothetical protein
LKDAAVINDSTTLEGIRRFLAAEKPASLGPVDIAQMVIFMVRKAEDHDVYDSQQTLARMLNTDPRTIARSQKKLEAPGIAYISRPQRRGRTNAISIRYENVPGEEILRAKVTPEAKELSVRYKRALEQNFHRKKFPKTWLPQQFVSAQRILNLCSGDMDLARRVIGHALSDGPHKKKASQSLYNLLGRWPQIVHTFQEKVQSIPPPTEVTKQAEQSTAHSEELAA